MKKYLAALALSLCLSAPFASAFTLDANVQELAAGGLLDFHSSDGTRFVADAAYGYYIMDLFQLRLEGRIHRSGQEKIYAAGVGAEVAFDMGLTLYPYVGGRLQLAAYDTLGRSGGAGILGAKVGGMVFLTEDVAIYSELTGDWATSWIFADDNRRRPFDATILLGFRFFFR